MPARFLSSLFALVGALAAAAVLSAQTVSEPSLKAAFLVRFAKFTDWPADALGPQAPIVFCAFDSQVADALTRATATVSVGSHPLSVTHLEPEASARDCSIVYVSGLDDRRVAVLVGALRDSSVLSVGDDEAFMKGGGIIRLFIEDGHMRFAINPQAAERAHLRISAQVLTLARIVSD
jgi:hypothetical protein